MQTRAQRTTFDFAFSSFEFRLSIASGIELLSEIGDFLHKQSKCSFRKRARTRQRLLPLHLLELLLLTNGVGLPQRDEAKRNDATVRSAHACASASCVPCRRPQSQAGPRARPTRLAVCVWRHRRRSSRRSRPRPSFVSWWGKLRAFVNKQTNKQTNRRT